MLTTGADDPHFDCRLSASDCDYLVDSGFFVQCWMDGWMDTRPDGWMVVTD